MKLQIGHNMTIECREENLEHEVVKVPLKIVFISDLHITRWSEPSMEQIQLHIQQVQPDLILLGGDYAESLRGLELMEPFLKSLTKECPVLAIAGKQDYFFGIERVRKVLVNAGIQWIHNDSVKVTIAGQEIRIDGNQTLHSSTSTARSDFRILLLHHPIHPTRVEGRYDLIFGGHLHGGQVVWKEKDNALYPGKWINDLNYRKVEVENALYLISTGAGDSIPIRYNCPREILFVSVVPQSISNSGSKETNSKQKIVPISINQSA